MTDMTTSNGGKSEPRKKNIYRRPLSRQRAQSTAQPPGGDSPCRRLVEADFLRPWSSEPDDIYSWSDEFVDLDQVAELPDECGERRQTLDSSGSTQGTTAFRPRARSMPVAGNSILKKHHKGMLQEQRYRKQCCFKEKVDVFYIPRQGELSMDTVSPDLAKLKIDPDQGSGKAVIRKAQNDTSKPLQWLTKPVRKVLDTSPNNPHAFRSRKVNRKHVVPIVHTDVKVIPFFDSRGIQKSKVRVMLSMSDSCVQDRTSVKALSGGTALIVLLYQNEARDGGSAILHEHTERIPLPVAVDPYQVKAQMHRNGDLEVTAPLMSDNGEEQFGSRWQGKKKAYSGTYVLPGKGQNNMDSDTCTQMRIQNIGPGWKELH